MPRFAIDPADESFLDTAPQRFVGTFDIPRPADAVWADLTSDAPLAWCRIIKRITWTSPRPFGVGTLRTAHTLAGVMVVEERFFRWEEGRRKSFMGVAGSLPMFKRLAEDYLVEPTGDASCHFTWTIAVEPPKALKPTGSAANKALLGTLFADTRKFYGLG